MSCPTDQKRLAVVVKLAKAFFFARSHKSLFFFLLFFTELGGFSLVHVLQSPTIISPIYVRQTAHASVLGATHIPSISLTVQEYKRLQVQMVMARIQKLTPTITQTPTQINVVSPTPTIKQTRIVIITATPTKTPTQSTTPLPTQTPSQPTPTTGQSSQPSSDAVNKLLGLINSARSQHDASALSLDGTISNCALTHSKAMGSRNGLFHDLENDVCITANAKAENVGMSTEPAISAVDTVHNGMMGEGPGGGHYENIINARYNKIGIGIYYDGHTSWITEDFAGN